MVRKIWFFFAVLTLLLGLEVLGTRSIVLTSEATKALAQQSEQLEKRRKFFEAIMGNQYQYPEKEVPINHAIGYGFLVISGIGMMHVVLLPSRPRDRRGK
ncbi:MAG: hypothetical protein Q4A17_07940 [Thermoguttaceae bacterium]|nr:hypothetical protein [Thermoguttaceae bacterium]MDO4857861.1 hypothetical protein [Thermoguttaceae bacterium]